MPCAQECLGIVAALFVYFRCVNYALFFVLLSTAEFLNFHLRFAGHSLIAIPIHSRKHVNCVYLRVTANCSSFLFNYRYLRFLLELGTEQGVENLFIQYLKFNFILVEFVVFNTI